MDRAQRTEPVSPFTCSPGGKHCFTFVGLHRRLAQCSEPRPRRTLQGCVPHAYVRDVQRVIRNHVHVHVAKLAAVAQVAHDKRVRTESILPQPHLGRA
jgi:hypothetical protein